MTRSEISTTLPVIIPVYASRVAVQSTAPRSRYPTHNSVLYRRVLVVYRILTRRGSSTCPLREPCSVTCPPATMHLLYPQRKGGASLRGTGVNRSRLNQCRPKSVDPESVEIDCARFARQRLTKSQPKSGEPESTKSIDHESIEIDAPARTTSIDQESPQSLNQSRDSWQTIGSHPS